MNFNEKYRPTTLAQCLLPDEPGAAQIIRDAAQNNTDQNILFFGPMGTGKSLFANLIAKELERAELATFQTLQGTKLRTATKVDDAIELFEKEGMFLSLPGMRRICIIEEFDRVHRESQLNFAHLFDRPGFQFFLTTNHVDEIDRRIVSRTLNVRVTGGTQQDMTALALDVFAKEGVAATPAEVSKLVGVSKGNIRDLLSLLEGRVLHKRATGAVLHNSVQVIPTIVP